MSTRYHLEVVERTLKRRQSYARLAAPVLHTWRWKQVVVCGELEPLKRIARKNCRIIDSETGEEVFRTDCPAIW